MAGQGETGHGRVADFGLPFLLKGTDGISAIVIIYESCQRLGYWSLIGNVINSMETKCCVAGITVGLLQIEKIMANAQEKSCYALGVNQVLTANSMICTQRLFICMP